MGMAVSSDGAALAPAVPFSDFTDTVIESLPLSRALSCCISAFLAQLGGGSLGGFAPAFSDLPEVA